MIGDNSMAICSNDISFIVQGISKKKYMIECVNSIRKYYPNAQIILSTWKNSDIEGISYDKLVLNDDPGAEYLDVEKKNLYNINRMLLSVKNGLKEADRKYVIKCRCDLLFKNSNLIENFDKFPNRDSGFSVTSKKILVGELFSLKYEEGEKEKYYTPFHVSDFFCFGLKEDIEKLYSAPLVQLDEFARYYEKHEKPREYPVDGYKSRLWRFPPEQYLTLELAKTVLGDLDFEGCLSYEKVDNEISEQFIISNFIILGYKQSGIKCQKFPFDIWNGLMLCPDRIYNGMYRHYLYQQDYKKYLDKDYVVSSDSINNRRRFFRIYHIMKPYLKPILNPLFVILQKR